MDSDQNSRSRRSMITRLGASITEAAIAAAVPNLTDVLYQLYSLGLAIAQVT